MNTYLILGLTTAALVILGLFWIFAVKKSLKLAEERLDQSWNEVKTYCAQRFDQLNEIHQSIEQFAPEETAILTKIERSKNFIAIAWQKDEVSAYVSGEELIKELNAELPQLARTNASLAKSDAFIRSARNLIGEGPGNQAEKIEAKNRVNEAMNARDRYNDVTFSFNEKIAAHPTKAIAKMFGLQDHQMATVDNVDASRIEITG